MVETRNSREVLENGIVSSAIADNDPRLPGSRVVENWFQPGVVSPYIGFRMQLNEARMLTVKVKNGEVGDKGRTKVFRRGKIVDGGVHTDEGACPHDKGVEVGREDPSDLLGFDELGQSKMRPIDL